MKGPYGEVWLDILNAPAEHVYNVPITLAPVFPGEQVGIARSTAQLEMARRTARTVRLEGGNDLVYQPLIRARLEFSIWSGLNGKWLIAASPMVSPTIAFVRPAEDTRMQPTSIL